MKNIGLAIILIVFSVLPAGAFDLGGEKFEGTLSMTWLSKYVISLGAEAHKKQVINQEVSILHPKSGFYAGIWLSQSPNGKPDAGEEQNYYIGKITKLALGLELDAKYQFIGVTKIGDLHEFVLGFSHPDWWPYWKVHYLLRQSVKSPDGGFFQEIGLAPSLELPSIAAGFTEAIKFDAKLVVNHGVIGIDPGLTHVAFKLQLPVSFKSITLIPEVRHQVVFDRFVGENPGDVNKRRHTTWGGVTLQYKF